MLTPALRQVNHGNAAQMVNSANNGQAAVSGLEDFLQQRKPSRVLLVSSGRGCDLPGQANTRIVRINTSGQEPGSVDCLPDHLPFQSRVFELVLAHEVLCDGREPGLAEFERVLEGGGHLVIWGPCYWGSRHQLARRQAGRAAIRPLRLCRELEQRDFVIEECSGQGLAGVALSTGQGWRKPLVGVSDHVMIRARSHGQGPIVTPLRFGRTQAAGVHSAALDGLNREAVS